MRSGCALLVSLAVCSAAGIAQSELPDADHTWVVGAKAMRQRNSQAPLQITLHSGLRIAVPPQDVHEYGTAIVRRATMTQANPSVRPPLLFVLQTRGTAPVGRSDVDVTLASGTIVRVRAGDVNDVRLTFLRTTLAQERSRLAEAARPRAAPPPETEMFKAIQFDTKGVEFGPWLRRFVAQVRRNWIAELYASPEAMAADGKKQAQVVATFSVHKDGSLTDVSIKEPSDVAVFNESTLRALLKSSPTLRLPPDYPDQSVSFTVTFSFNLPSPDVKK